MSDEVARCVEAYIAAWKKAAESDLPTEECSHLARLAFEMQYGIEGEKYKLLNLPNAKVVA
jgi:hypothetical protein